MKIGKYIELYSEDLKLKNYSENTIKNYTNQVKCFLEYFNNTATKPSEISEKQIKEWLLLAKSINGRKHRISAVKLFYKFTGKQPLKFRHIEYPKSEKKLPQIIEKEFLLDRISKIKNKKHKAIIALAYSTGMRVSEVCNLKIEDIDSKRMIINIRQAKGRKDRIVALSQNILEIISKSSHRRCFCLTASLTFNTRIGVAIKLSNTILEKIIIFICLGIQMQQLY